MSGKSCKLITLAQKGERNERRKHEGVRD
jgi:hypothetical protein